MPVSSHGSQVEGWASPNETRRFGPDYAAGNDGGPRTGWMPLLPPLQEKLQRARHAVAPRLMAHITLLAAYEFLHLRHRIVRCGNTGRELAVQHGQVVE